MSNDLAISTTEVLECLRFVRSHLYAATVQSSDQDDRIIRQHVLDAYMRVSDVCRMIDQYGMKFFGQDVR